MTTMVLPTRRTSYKGNLLEVAWTAISLSMAGALVAMTALFLLGEWWGFLLPLAIFVLVGGYVVAGVRQTPMGHEWLIEIHGRYSHSWESGLHILLLGIIKVGAEVDMREIKENLYPGNERLDVQDGDLGIDATLVFQVTNALRAHYQLQGGIDAVRAVLASSVRDFMQTFFQKFTVGMALSMRGTRLDDRLRTQEAFENLRIGFQDILATMLEALGQSSTLENFNTQIAFLVPILEQRLREEDELEDLEVFVGLLCTEFVGRIAADVTTDASLRALKSNDIQERIARIATVWQTARERFTYRAFTEDHARWGVTVVTLIVADWKLSPALLEGREAAAREDAAAMAQEKAIRTARLQGQALAATIQAEIYGIATMLAGYSGEEELEDRSRDEADERRKNIAEKISNAENLYLRKEGILAVKASDKVILTGSAGIVGEAVSGAVGSEAIRDAVGSD